MVKKIRCDVASGDWVKAKVSDGGDLVFIQMAFYGEFPNVMLSPADARKLRKQIKKAIEAIEGGDEEEVATTSNAPIPKFSVGDKARVLVDEPEWAGLKKGEIVTVTKDLQEKTKDGNWQINGLWKVHGEYLEPA